MVSELISCLLLVLRAAVLLIVVPRSRYRWREHCGNCRVIMYGCLECFGPDEPPGQLRCEFSRPKAGCTLCNCQFVRLGAQSSLNDKVNMVCSLYCCPYGFRYSELFALGGTLGTWKPQNQMWQLYWEQNVDVALWPFRADALLSPCHVCCAR